MTAKISRFSPVSCSIRPKWLTSLALLGASALGAAGVAIYELDVPLWATGLTLGAFGAFGIWRDVLHFRPEFVAVDAGTLIIRGRRELEVPTDSIRAIRIGQESFEPWIVPRNLIERLTGKLTQFPTHVTVELPKMTIRLSFLHSDEAREFVQHAGRAASTF